VALEPIRQVNADGKREKIAATALAEYFTGWKMYATPAFTLLTFTFAYNGATVEELYRRFRNQMAKDGQ
jgi:hypothetical protein